MRRLTRTIKPVRPAEVDLVDALAYSLWMPDQPANRGIVIVHGAGSCKESHHDYARAAIAAGFGAIAFDLRGHGDSEGPMRGRVLDDIATVAELLRSRLGSGEAPIALRGSSMGGYFAIAAAARADAAAVVAICPASASGIRRGLEVGTLRFATDGEAFDRFLSMFDERRAVDSLQAPLLLLHAEGDDVVPVQHSRELAGRMGNPQSRLITVPGGHHQSVQHDPELQALSLRWLDGVLGPGPGQTP